MNVALVLSGGLGTRLGTDIPKQYIEVCGKPVVVYCLDTLCKSNEIDAIHIVAAKEWQAEILSWLDKFGIRDKFKGFSIPGENRQMSVYNGLRDIRVYASEEDLVLVHDAARPLLSCGLITRCFEAIEGHDGVLPVLPMKDTVYLSGDGERITSLLDRSKVFAGQAPELFRLGAYCRANEDLLPDKIRQINGSAEAAVLGGLNITMVSGDEDNFKITTSVDLERFSAVCRRGMYEGMGTA